MMIGRRTWLVALGVIPGVATAHPGGLDANGCHHNRKTGDYHCHRPHSGPIRVESLPGDSRIYYRNCSAVRAAGAAPIRVGDPGYGRHLDRDGDGLACE
jgi:hypothetical protein